LSNLSGPSISRVTIINEDADYTHPDHDRLKLDDYDTINWPSLKIALEDRIRSSDLVKYDENISSNIYLFLVCIKI
jgi:hypothetical protein